MIKYKGLDFANLQDLRNLYIPQKDSEMDSPKAYDFFITLSESNQKYYIDWIEAAKKVETKAERIVKTVERLENGLKFYDWENQA